MIGIDTNILIRIFIDDDPAQVAKARKLVTNAGAGGVLISIVVLVEFIWTLRAKFKVEKADLIDVLEGLLTRVELVIEDRLDVDAALQSFKASNVDVADCLIATRNRRLGASKTVSFDQTAIRNSIFEAP